MFDFIGLRSFILAGLQARQKGRFLSAGYRTKAFSLPVAFMCDSTL